MGRRGSGAGGTADDGVVVFGEAANVPPFEGDIVGQRFEAMGAGTAPATVGQGCGTNVLTAFGFTGPFALGNPDFALQINQVPASAVLFLSIGLLGPLLGQCGTCALINPITFDFVANVGGTGTRPLPLPCNPLYLGVALECQWVLFNTAASPCPSVPSLSASARIILNLLE